MTKALLRAGVLLLALPACAATVESGTGPRLDGGGPAVEAGSGLNPDGADPFHPTDAPVILVDGAVPADADGGAWQLPDGATADERLGSFYIGTYLAGGVGSTYVQADFRYSFRPEDPRCSYHGAGAWDVQVCEDGGSPPEDTHPRPFPHAGTITIRGGLEAITLTPTLTDDQYEYFYASRVLLPGPRSVRVQATGSTVPAFDVTLEIPPALRLVAPTSPPGEALTLRRAAGLEIAWADTTAPSVYASLTQTSVVDGRSRTTRLAIEFFGSSGRGTIPAAALADLRPRAEGGGEASLSITPYRMVTARAGAWPLQFTLAGEGRALRVHVE